MSRRCWAVRAEAGAEATPSSISFSAAVVVGDDPAVGPPVNSKVIDIGLSTSI